MSQKQIEAKMLRKIAPTEEESKAVQRIAASFIKTLQKEIKDAKVILGGSVAKDTFFKDKTDIDVFVQFDYQKYNTKSAKLSDLLSKLRGCMVQEITFNCKKTVSHSKLSLFF